MENSNQTNRIESIGGGQPEFLRTTRAQIGVSSSRVTQALFYPSPLLVMTCPRVSRVVASVRLANDGPVVQRREIPASYWSARPKNSTIR